MTTADTMKTAMEYAAQDRMPVLIDKLGMVQFSAKQTERTAYAIQWDDHDGFSVYDANEGRRFRASDTNAIVRYIAGAILYGLE